MIHVKGSFCVMLKMLVVGEKQIPKGVSLPPLPRRPPRDTR